jgi:hypothetical protein
MSAVARAALSAPRGSPGSIVAGALLHANAGVALAASVRAAWGDGPLLQRQRVGVRVRGPLERRQLHRAVCRGRLAGRRLQLEPV